MGLKMAWAQYKQTDQWQKYKVMLLRLYFSAVSKYYSQKLILNIHKIIRGYSRYAKLKYYKLQ